MSNPDDPNAWVAKAAAGGDLKHVPFSGPFSGPYLHKDTPTADYSDVLVVTVPGKG